MKILEIMSQPAVACNESDSLSRAAQLMWENDCGAIPVVGDDGRVTGIVTDRDVCMASYTQGRALDSIPVSGAMSRQVSTCHGEDSLETAERLMGDKQIRRVPVVDTDNRPIGVLSMNDIARHAAVEDKSAAHRDVVRAMAAICQPRLPVKLAAAGGAPQGTVAQH